MDSYPWGRLCLALLVYLFFFCLIIVSFFFFDAAMISDDTFNLEVMMIHNSMNW